MKDESAPAKGRARAAQVLASLGRAEGAQFLAAAVDSPSADLCAAAVEMLGHWRSKIDLAQPAIQGLDIRTALTDLHAAKVIHQKPDELLAKMAEWKDKNEQTLDTTR
jgi:hypothetical protein